MPESAIDEVRNALTSASVIRVGDHIFVIFFIGQLQHVVSLNPSAATFVSLIETEGPNDDIPARYAEALGIPEAVASEFISVIRDDWAQLGVIGPDAGPGSGSGFKFAPAPPVASKATFDSLVTLGGDQVRVVLYDPDLAEITVPMIEGTQRGEALNRPFTIHAWRDGDTWLVADSSGASETLDRAEVARDRVLAKLMANSWPELQEAPCIHGATLRAPNGRHVMLSGDSGRGKTTLALGLAKHSFTLLADDMSVFDAATGRLLPIKSNPSVKEGAWEPLSELYPELSRQTPVMVNGRLCKYVRRGASQGRENPHGIDALIFPKWQPGAAAKLTPYDSQASLLSMLRWSYLPQNQENLQAMADFLSSLPLYELTYETFEQADRMLLDLMECKT